MQAGTHIAGAALTAAVLRGFGVEIGPPEVLALVVGSLLPDIDTTTSGTGRFVKPVSKLIETKFGHRTLTHSLLFTLLFSNFFDAMGTMTAPSSAPERAAMPSGVISSRAIAAVPDRMPGRRRGAPAP